MRALRVCARDNLEQAAQLTLHAPGSNSYLSPFIFRGIPSMPRLLLAILVVGFGAGRARSVAFASSGEAVALLDARE